MIDFNNVTNWLQHMSNHAKGIFNVVSTGWLEPEENEPISTNMTILQIKDLAQAEDWMSTDWKAGAEFGWPESYQDHVLEVLGLPTECGFVAPGATYYNYSVHCVTTDIIIVSETIAMNV